MHFSRKSRNLIAGSLLLLPSCTNKSTIVRQINHPAPMAQVAWVQKPEPEVISIPPKPTEKDISDAELATMFYPVAESLSAPSQIDIYFRVDDALYRLVDIATKQKKKFEAYPFSKNEKLKIWWMVVAIGNALNGLPHSQDVQLTNDYIRVKGKLSYEANYAGYFDYPYSDQSLDFTKTLRTRWEDDNFRSLSEFIQFLFSLSAPYRRGTRLSAISSNSPYTELMNSFIHPVNVSRYYGEERHMPSKHFLLGRQLPGLPISGINHNPNYPGRKFSVAPPFDKPVILNGWSLYCAPCMKELPDFDVFHKNGTAFVIGYEMAMQGELADPKRIEESFAPGNGKHPELSFPLITGPQSRDVYGRDFGEPLPFTVILDRDGIVRKVIVGITDKEELTQILSGL